VKFNVLFLVPSYRMDRKLGPVDALRKEYRPNAVEASAVKECIPFDLNFFG
jgi:hypothetical protein